MNISKLSYFLTSPFFPVFVVAAIVVYNMSAETPSSQPFSGLPGENQDGATCVNVDIDFDVLRESGIEMNVDTGMNVGMNVGNQSNISSGDNQYFSVNSILKLCKSNNPENKGMSIENMLQQISYAQCFLQEQQQTLLGALKPEQRQVYEHILSSSHSGNTVNSGNSTNNGDNKAGNRRIKGKSKCRE